jgi:hypothetical protein
MNNFLKISLALGLVALIALSCSRFDQPSSPTAPESMDAAAPAAKLGVPVVTFVDAGQHDMIVQVCGDAVTGAPVGFTLQWTVLPAGMACEDYVWNQVDPMATCQASFSGVPGCSEWGLAPGACVEINIGTVELNICGYSIRDDVYDEYGNLLIDYCDNDELECGTTYVVRAFAHNVPKKPAGPFAGYNRSDFSPNVCFSTLPCGENCTHTIGYWSTHGPVGCVQGNNENMWPVTELMIGGRTYSDGELCLILNRTASGCKDIILAHQLIAAMLSMANGATAPSDCDVDAASALLTNNLTTSCCSGGPSTCPNGSLMTTAAGCLDLYNNGYGNVPHCP